MYLYWDVETDIESNNLVLITIYDGTDCQSYDCRNFTEGIDRLVANQPKLVAHNAKFDCSVIYKQFGILLQSKCTFLRSQLFFQDPLDLGEDIDGKKTKHSLRAIAKRILGVNISKEQQTSFKDGQTWETLSTEQKEYAEMDVLLLPKLFQYLTNKLNEIYVPKSNQDIVSQYLTLCVTTGIEPDWGSVSQYITTKAFGGELLVALNEETFISTLVLSEVKGVKIDEEALIANIQNWEAQSAVWYQQCIKSLLTVGLPMVHTVVTTKKTTAKGQEEPTIKVTKSQKIVQWNFLSDKQVKAIFELAGHGSNIGKSYTELWDKQKFPKKASMPKKTDRKNNVSVIKDTIEQDVILSWLNVTETILEDFLSNYLKYRETEKLISVYGKGIQSLVKNGRLYHSFESIGANTGRMSCRSPNIQNFPKDPQVRRICVPDDGYVFIDADYSQIEVVIAEQYSKDPLLTENLDNGLDLHGFFGSDVYELIFGVPTKLFKTKIGKDEVVFVNNELITSLTDKKGVVREYSGETLRSDSKQGTFGSFYGAGEPRCLAIFSKYIERHYTGNTSVLGKQISNVYKSKMAGFFQWANKLVKFYQEHLFIPTSNLGRRVKFKHYYNDSGVMKPPVGEIYNSPMQTTCAELLKMASNRITKRFRQEGLDAHIWNLIHDEIIAHCRIEDQEKVLLIVKTEMEQAAQFFFKRIIKVFPKTINQWSK